MGAHVLQLCSEWYISTIVLLCIDNFGFVTAAASFVENEGSVL